MSVYYQVSRPMALPPNTRNMLYRGLPVGVKASLRSRLLSFHVDSDDDDERVGIHTRAFPLFFNVFSLPNNFGYFKNL